MVRVEDTERAFWAGRAPGARIINPPTTYPYGERQYTALDSRHRWNLL